jgi:hypothetical protein
MLSLKLFCSLILFSSVVDEYTEIVNRAAVALFFWKNRLGCALSIIIDFVEKVCLSTRTVHCSLSLFKFVYLPAINHVL